MSALATDPVIERFLDGLWLEAGLSRNTLSAYRSDLEGFAAWIKESPARASRAQLQAYLAECVRRGARPRTTARLLSSLRRFYHYLLRENEIGEDPTAQLESPKLGRPLPKSLSEEQVEALLAAPASDTPLGLRDRSMLETLYATGLRRMELPGVSIYDIDLNRGVLWVRHGKGNRERVVPLGDRAMAWLDKYLIESRPQLLACDTSALFLTDYGEPVQPHYVADKVKRYMQFAGVNKTGSTHLLRHACATHMLEGGADIRYIQEMLGHANLQTTEIYTHVSIDKLIAVHGATHPSRLTRHRDNKNPVTGPSLGEVSGDAAEALLTAIADEDEAEASGVAADAPKAARR